MSNAKQVPLEEQLRSVPKGGIAFIEIKSNSRPWLVKSRTNVPYGRMCHEAAVELRRQHEEITRLRVWGDKWKNEAMLMGAHQGIDNHQRLIDRAEKAEAECDALRAQLQMALERVK